jgi:hypothetical protein
MYDEASMPVPATARDVATWAIAEGHWQPRDADIISQCAEDLARALRDEYRTDAFGRRYRTKHAVRITRGGIQYSLWADIDSAPRPHMERAFAQRRQQIVGDCHQLRVDVDVYNDRHTEDAPIQLVLDFTRDVEELLHLDNDKAA